MVIGSSDLTANTSSDEHDFLNKLANFTYKYSMNCKSFRIRVNPVIDDAKDPEHDGFVDNLTVNEINCNRLSSWASRLSKEGWMPSESEVKDALTLYAAGTNNISDLFADYSRFSKTPAFSKLAKPLDYLWLAEKNLDDFGQLLIRYQERKMLGLSSW